MRRRRRSISDASHSRSHAPRPSKKDALSSNLNDGGIAPSIGFASASPADLRDSHIRLCVRRGRTPHPEFSPKIPTHEWGSIPHSYPKGEVGFRARRTVRLSLGRGRNSLLRISGEGSAVAARTGECVNLAGLPARRRTRGARLGPRLRGEGREMRASNRNSRTARHRVPAGVYPRAALRADPGAGNFGARVLRLELDDLDRPARQLQADLAAL